MATGMDVSKLTKTEEVVQSGSAGTGSTMDLYRQDGFELNKQLSLKKKLEACQRPDVMLKPYKGGIIMDFSAVFFEALKAAMNTFYDTAAEDLTMTPRWRRDVHLRQSSHRDVLSVKTLDGEHEYTVQLFHTTSRLQVNGKHFSRFLTRDMIDLRGIINHYIDVSGHKTSDLNKQLADILRSALTKDDSLEIGQQNKKSQKEGKDMKTKDAITLSDDQVDDKEQESDLSILDEEYQQEKVLNSKQNTAQEQNKQKKNHSGRTNAQYCLIKGSNLEDKSGMESP